MLFLRVQLHCAMGSNWSKFMWSMSGWCLTPFADCQCHRLSQLGQSNYINGSPSYHSVCVWCVSTASTSFIQCPVRGCRIPENETRENFVSIAWFFLLGVHCRVLFLFFFCMTLTRTRSGWAHVKSIRTFFWTRYHYPSSILRLEWLTGIYGQVHQLETRFFSLFHVEEVGETHPLRHLEAQNKSKKTHQTFHHQKQRVA